MMKKTASFKFNKWLTGVLIPVLIALHCPLCPVPQAEAMSVYLTAPSAVIMDESTGAVLYSKSPNVKRAPASTVKILTALVILDRLPLDQWVTISSRVEGVEPSKLYLRGGEKIQVYDLLQAILMNSANDAALALAIGAAGSEYEFSKMMNQKAIALGAQNSNFKKASGLPAEGQYSTVYDLALIMRAAMNSVVIASILKKKASMMRTAEGKVYYLKSHNKMLWRRYDVIGKTGWTRQAGYCFVGSAGYAGKRLIVSMLGSKRLWTDVTAMAQAMSGYKPRELISYGDRGNDVFAIQSALRRAGYFHTRATGYYGKITVKAVRSFQRAKKIEADGIVGAETRAALSSYM